MGTKGEQVVRKARCLKAAFGAKCSKFAGAVSVEILKRALANEGIRTSSRDVFVRGIPVEVALIVPHNGQKPTLGLLYELQQVAAALPAKSGPEVSLPATFRRSWVMYRTSSCRPFAWIVMRPLQVHVRDVQVHKF